MPKDYSHQVADNEEDRVRNLTRKAFNPSTHYKPAFCDQAFKAFRQLAGRVMSIEGFRSEIKMLMPSFNRTKDFDFFIEYLREKGYLVTTGWRRNNRAKVDTDKLDGKIYRRAEDGSIEMRMFEWVETPTHLAHYSPLTISCELNFRVNYPESSGNKDLVLE